MDKFSLDLAAECRPHGIVVQSVLPGYVATKLPGLSGKVSFDVPTPEYYVAAALRSVGVETRTAAHWFHKILVSFLNKKIMLLSHYFRFDSCTGWSCYTFSHLA